MRRFQLPRCCVPQRETLFHALLPQPGGFEGRRAIPSPFEPNDLSGSEGPGVGLLLNDFGFAPTTPCAEVQPSHHRLPGIGEVEEFVLGGVERLGDALKGLSKLRDASPHARLDRFWGVDELNVWGEEREDLLRMPIEQALLVDAAD